MARRRTFMVLDKVGRPLGTVRADSMIEAFSKARREYGEKADNVKRTAD